MNGKKWVFLSFAAIFLIYSGCDNFNISLEPYIDYATNTARVYNYEIETNHYVNNSAGFTALPPNKDTRITLFIHNPQNYDLSFSLIDDDGYVVQNIDFISDGQIVSFTIPGEDRSEDDFKYTLKINQDDTDGRLMSEWEMPVFQYRYFDNNLEGLTVEDGNESDVPLDPAFSANDDRQLYFAEISRDLILEGKNNFTLSAATLAPYAWISVDGNDWEAGGVDQFEIPANRSNRIISIVVTADSGLARTYTLTVGGAEVAEHAGIKYLTLQEAITAASGGTESTPRAITILRPFTAQANGYTLTSGTHIRLVTHSDDGEIIIVSPSGDHSLFTVNTGASLELSPAAGTNLILCGGENSPAENLRRGVTINSGTFTMNDRSVIRNFKNNNAGGGGAAAVWVGGNLTNGIFNMRGGTIERNHAVSGGGAVRIANGEFYMSGGRIENNSTDGAGGGVYIGNNINKFIMSGGYIYGSNAGAYNPSGTVNTATDGHASLHIHPERDLSYGNISYYNYGSYGNGSIASTDGTLPYASNYITGISFGHANGNSNAEIVSRDGTTIRAAVPVIDLYPMNVTIHHTGRSVAIMNGAVALRTIQGSPANFTGINMTGATHIIVTASDNFHQDYSLTLQTAAAQMSGIYYPTLNQAIAALPNISAGGTIPPVSILRDITVPEPGMTVNGYHNIADKELNISASGGSWEIISTSNNTLFDVKSNGKFILGATGGNVLTIHNNNVSSGSTILVQDGGIAQYSGELGYNNNPINIFTMASNTSGALPIFVAERTLSGVTRRYTTLNEAIRVATAGSGSGSQDRISIIGDIRVPEPGMNVSTGYSIADKHIQLVTDSAARTISASAGNFPLFTVAANSSLTLGEAAGNTLTLSGNNNSVAPLTNRRGVQSSGTLVMNNAVISGFVNGGNPLGGGGVLINVGEFIMNGGTIQNNVANVGNGGGVYVQNGTFTMHNGLIAGNRAGASNSIGQGGGIYVASSGSFKMGGGTINGSADTNPNTASHSITASKGAAIFVTPGATAEYFDIATGGYRSTYGNFPGTTNDLLPYTAPAITGTVIITGTGSPYMTGSALTATLSSDSNATNPVYKWERWDGSTNWRDANVNTANFTPTAGQNYRYRVVVTDPYRTDDITSSVIEVFQNITAMSQVTDASGNYRLTQNITITGNYTQPYFPATSSVTDRPTFYGIFEGGGHTIEMIDVIVTNNDNDGTGGGGLFRFISGRFSIPGIVRNLRLTGSLTAQDNAAAVANRNNNIGQIYNISSSVNVRATTSSNFEAMAGGIVVTNTSQAIIKNCYSTGSVTAEASLYRDAYAGGIVAYIIGGTVEYCWASGAISANSATANSHAGGIVGRGTLNNCVALNSRIESVAPNGTYASSGGGHAGNVSGRRDNAAIGEFNYHFISDAENNVIGYKQNSISGTFMNNNPPNIQSSWITADWLIHSSKADATQAGATDIQHSSWYWSGTTPPAGLPASRPILWFDGNVASTTPVILISTQPTATTNLNAGYTTSSNLEVNAIVTQGETLSYQWYSNTTASNSGGTAINGATGASFTIPTGLGVGLHHYFVEVRATGGATSVRSNVATVNVTPVISINTQPAATTTVTAGNISGSLSVSASAPGATLSYQWYSNITNSNTGGTLISGATNLSLTIPTTLTATGSPYYYYCIVSANFGATSVPSNVARVNVDPRPLTLGAPSALTYSNNGALPGRNALTPIERGTTYTERTATFTVGVNGFANEADSASVGLTFGALTGLTAAVTSSAFAGNTKTFTVTVTLLDNTAFASVTNSATINITGLSNIPSGYVYTGGGVSSPVNIIDGRAAFTGATGEIDRRIPVNQTNIAHFNAYANTAAGLTRHYKQTTTPITLTGTNNWTPIGTNSARFTGSFDGGGFIITGLNISGTTAQMGFFGVIDGGGANNDNGVVKNLGLTNVTINSTSTAATATGGTGGIAGRILNNARITHCSVSGTITGLNNVGGIVGSLGASSTVSNCYTNITITGTGTGSRTGGIAGEVLGSGATSGTIINCYSTGSITGNNAIGGIAGWLVSSTSQNSVRFCYSTATVYGNQYTGGLVGHSEGGAARRIADSVALNPSVTGDPVNIGRVLGYSSWMLSDNRARSDMRVNSFESTSDTGHQDKNGDSVNIGSSVASFFSRFNNSESGTWTIPGGGLTIGGNLPTLVGVPGVQAPTLPALPPVGSAANPMLISSDTMLANIPTNTIGLSGHYRLTANIDLPNNWTGNNIGPFTGTLDGNGFTINFNNTTGTTAPLFRDVGSGGKVTNLKLTGTINSTSSSHIIFGAVAWDNHGEISNISSSVTVNLSATSATAYAFAGGIVGINYGTGTIKNCYTTGNVTANSTANQQTIAGGIAARNNGTISNCWTSGIISATGGNTRRWSGGIVGYTESNPGNVSNCVALNADLRGTTVNRIDTSDRSYTNNWGHGDIRLNNVVSSTNWSNLNSGKDGRNLYSTDMNLSAWWNYPPNGNPAGAGWSSIWGGSLDARHIPWKWPTSGTNPLPILWFETTVNR